jgi:hypothetical protein
MAEGERDVFLVSKFEDMFLCKRITSIAISKIQSLQPGIASPSLLVSLRRFIVTHDPRSKIHFSQAPSESFLSCPTHKHVDL